MNVHGTTGTLSVKIFLGPKCTISSFPHSGNSHSEGKLDRPFVDKRLGTAWLHWFLG